MSDIRLPSTLEHSTSQDGTFILNLVCLPCTAVSSKWHRLQRSFGCHLSQMHPGWCWQHYNGGRIMF